MRRTLPSTRDLCCFEAVVRNGSVTRAAAELNMTQSAVSRRLGYLEDLLGQRLFLRERQRIIPTPAARDYADSLRGLLNEIEVATTRMLTEGRQGGVLTLGCLPTFGSRWLVPRLNRFLSTHPTIDINLVSKIRRFDFDSEDIQAAIYFGPAVWPNCNMRHLMGESVIPVAAPSLMTGASLPELLRGAPLIQHTTRPTLWREWLAHAGIGTLNGEAGPKFEFYSLVIEAAVAGIGFALLPEFLVQREIDSGALVRVSDNAMPCTDSYYYVYPDRYRESHNVQVFGNWLFKEMNAPDPAFQTAV
ncbi:transcriptional regulator, LysR family [Gemmobacter megaterium]|uniref:Transcriptional regulator, LysR family n=1 Tax=Gemmobacter megaterium TaxID=1086013 RepID=A0A1N7ND30_9RHOB|nr:LysR substrate-binding domain-containing protein [Gemmobacter megaterium]GGE14333.1 LysR family transcriptional regulator [Gemmobacter megaterium]SIS96190.1 transcriptional regulator, LysR family [Gemmobacter megaterium]